MRKFLMAFFVFACFLGMSAYLQAQDEPAGKTIFMNSKCNTCHSIESMAITKKMASSKAPDLSNVGSERKADWIIKWIKKEETLHEKKHLAQFNGTDEDLKKLAEWLETLKKPAEKQ